MFAFYCYQWKLWFVGIKRKSLLAGTLFLIKAGRCCHCLTNSFMSFYNDHYFFTVAKSSICHFKYFQLDSSVALSTFTLYNYHHYCPLPELSLHPQQKLCTHWTLPPFLLSPVPGNYHSTFCLYEFAYSRYLMSVGSYNICPFVSDFTVMSSRFIHIASCIRINFLIKAE